MTATKSLHMLIALPYLGRAIKSSKAHDWVEAEADIDRFAALLPDDYRAPLLRAKIRLHQGRLEECLDALGVAKQLGHKRLENDRMVRWIHVKDSRRHDRLVFRRRVRDQWHAQRRIIGGRVSFIWTNWGPHILFSGWIIAAMLLYRYLGQSS